MLNSLQNLYDEFDRLYSGILPICNSCKDHDCEGYLWILPEEEAPLYNAGSQIIEISGESGTCTFMNPLNSTNPKDFEKMKPKCPLRSNGLCSAYFARPLVCRIYPIGFLVIDGEICIILSKDCAYSRGLIGETRKNFINNILGIFANCSRELYDEIVGVYSVVDGYLKYPEGPNEYEVIGKL